MLLPINNDNIGDYRVRKFKFCNKKIDNVVRKCAYAEIYLGYCHYTDYCALMDKLGILAGDKNWNLLRYEPFIFILPESGHPIFSFTNKFFKKFMKADEKNLNDYVQIAKKWLEPTYSISVSHTSILIHKNVEK